MTDIQSELTNLIGRPCKNVKIRHYLNIALGFGDLIEKPTPRGSYKRYSWEISSWNGIWRVTKLDSILFGSGSNEAVIKAQLPSLKGLILERIEYQDFAGDLKVVFEGGLTVELLRLSIKDGMCWEISGPFGYFPPQGTTDNIDEEIALTEHSKNCFERWSQTLPMESKGRRCNNCAYYFQLRGVGYFWDFGVCTNTLSAYDGKVVNVGSVCDAFSHSLPNDVVQE